MTAGLTCWKCGADLAGVLLPLGRSAECPRCRADLWVCRMCEWYDPGAGRACREPRAEPGPDKERATFCDWFRPVTGRDSAGVGGADRARAGLEALFGGSGRSSTRQGAEESMAALERLFGKKDQP